ncbi:hypothetical protein BH11PAT2_BH11PAT2_08300 [soil metagenome]
MSQKYSHGELEKKWLEKWSALDIYKAENASDKPHCYVLDMFPYPSGSSMHVGHPRGYVATDVYSRFKRMHGFNVLHPMGWDAFGLPAEQTAIKNQEHPSLTVERNITKFKEQLLMMGLGYDWNREVNTTDPAFYRATQRIFLEFFKRGLAYNAMVEVNWCPELGTVLANEDIVDGKSERGGYPVFKQPMRQWVLRITAYADRLLNDLDKLPQWPDRVKNAQREWIGKGDEPGEFKIRDWVFSRQRFWGEPFPILWVEGIDNYELFKKSSISTWLPENPVSYKSESQIFFAVPVAPEYLSSMTLPNVDSYGQTGTTEGPLAGIEDWVNTYINSNSGEVSNNPSVQGPEWIKARRETNTMPQWAGSSWYWLRFMDSRNQETPFSRESADYWGPVNIYAGADHAVAHLIYARFWHKVMYDAGMVGFDEPFERLEFLGHVLAEDGSKISKRSGNSRSPEDVVEQVGADAFRFYEMMLGPFEKAVPWKDGGLMGAKRFLDKVWVWSNIVLDRKPDHTDPNTASDLQKLITRTSADIEAFRFNIAASNMIKFLNANSEKTIRIEDMLEYVKILAPFCPFLAEEIWSRFSDSSIHIATWPTYDPEKVIHSETVTIPIQINGKRRSEITVSININDNDLKDAVIQDDTVQKYLEGKELRNFIRVKNKIVSLVV